MADPRAIVEAYRRKLLNPAQVKANLPVLYRSGVLPQPQAQAYEEAVRRGLVVDGYASGRMDARKNLGADGFVQTIDSTVPGMSEAEGAIQSLVGMGKEALSGQPVHDFSAHWKANRDWQQGVLDEYRAQHPVLAGTAKGLGFGGQMAAAIGTGGASEAPELAEGASTLAGKAGQLATNVATRVARNAPTGAAWAAANAAAQPGTLQQRAEAAAKAVPAGAALGAAIPEAAGVVGKGVGALADQARRIGSAVSESAGSAGRAIAGTAPESVVAQTPPISPQAMQDALPYIRRLGATPESIRANAAAAGSKPITSAEAIGPQGISQVAALVRRPGQSSTFSEASLQPRAFERGNRILGDIHDITGIQPEHVQGQIDQMVANGRELAKPLYDAAYAAPGASLEDVGDLVNRPSMRMAMSRAVRIAAEEGRNPTELGFQWDTQQFPGGTTTVMDRVVDPSSGAVRMAPRQVPLPPTSADVPVQVQNPTPQTWDYVKRGLDDVMNTHRDPLTGKLKLDEEGRAVLGTLNDFRGVLTDKSPEYAEALNTSGDYLSQLDAFNRTKGMLLSRSTSESQFGKYFNDLSPSQQDAARAAIANDVYLGVRNGVLKPGSLTTPAVQGKLSTAFGDDAAAELAKRMDMESRMAAAEGRMRQNLNSTTGDVVGMDTGQPDVAGAALSAGKSLLNGNPVGAVAKGVTTLAAPAVRGYTAAADQATRDAVGHLLMNTTPEELARMLEATSSQPSSQPLLTGASQGAAGMAGVGSADQSQDNQ